MKSQITTGGKRHGKTLAMKLAIKEARKRRKHIIYFTTENYEFPEPLPRKKLDHFNDALRMAIYPTNLD